MNRLDTEERTVRGGSSVHLRSDLRRFKRGTGLSPVSSWLVPSPRYFAKPKGLRVLLNRVVAYSCLRSRVGTNHTTLVCEEVAVSSLAWKSRVPVYRKPSVDTAGRNRRVQEVIAALRSSRSNGFRQYVVNQARCR